MKHAEYIEKKRHGSPDFPIEYYYLDKEQPQYIMQPHWHKEFEIIRVVDGCFIVHLNTVTYTLNSGDILLVEGGCLHTGEPQNSIYECLVFDPAMLKRQQNDAAEKYLSPVIHSQVSVKSIIDQSDTQLHHTITALIETMRKQAPCYELEIYSMLFNLLAQLYTQKYITFREKSVYSHQTQTIISLIEWIEKNFSNPIDLEKLSAFSGLSPKYLCRLFKEYTSKTLVQYINELRIENACYEMAIKGKNSTEASFNSGFNDLSYFCKIFKQYKGITPKEYKKQYYSIK